MKTIVYYTIGFEIDVPREKIIAQVEASKYRNGELTDDIVDELKMNSKINNIIKQLDENDTYRIKSIYHFSPIKKGYAKIWE